MGRTDVGMVSRRRHSPSMGPSMSSAGQFFGDVLPENLTPIKLFFFVFSWYFLETEPKLRSSQHFWQKNL